MLRYFISSLLVLCLFAAPVMASVCAKDCAGAVAQHHMVKGEKEQGKTKNTTHTSYHCCHASKIQMLYKDNGVTFNTSKLQLLSAHTNDRAGQNPSPLLEPPSPV